MTDKKASRAFLLALGLSFIIFLPFVIFDRGYFIYFGDFNVQQIPFYKLAHEAVRSGDIFWNWYTDLGANFIASYSFYLLFSPFFWLTLPFPTEALPMLMAPLLILKTACSAFTAYLYIERFVKNKNFAVTASLFYAFSGWMSFNVFFNHFHDVAVFFPLLLLGVEKFVFEKKRGFFAIAVFINAIVNYWFFIGEVVFVILYFIFRMTDKNFRYNITIKQFLLLFLESVLGAGLATVVLLPSALGLMGNPRTGTDELLTGSNFWFYWYPSRPAGIIQSLFFPPELQSRPNFLTGHEAKWASLSAWLPMISLSGVIAYFIDRRWDWIKKLLLACLIIALVPGLNSMFILFNNSYYARWFYMPILIMAAASARVLERCRYDAAPLKKGLCISLVFILLFAVMCGLTPGYDEDKNLIFGLAEHLPKMWGYVGFAIAGIFLTHMALKYRKTKNFIKVFTIFTAFIIVTFNIFYIITGKGSPASSRFMINTAIKGRDELLLPEDSFARADSHDAMHNILMYWHLPNIQAFHSIVPASIMEFYPSVGVKRDVSSHPEADYYPLRPLFSVRWLFIEADKEEQEPMPGYTKYSTQIGFNIYENENYIPMGFAYDKYIFKTNFMNLPEGKRDNVLLKAVVLDDEAVLRCGDILDELDGDSISRADADSFTDDCNARKLYTVTDFTIDKRGFSAKSDFTEDRFIFFSVPYENGWSAFINGSPVQIEKANIGFMAVKVPAGENDIRFEYMTPGLITGGYISLASLFLLLVYALTVKLIRIKKRTPADPRTVNERLAAGEKVRLTPGEYAEEFKNTDRRADLQRALNEAYIKNIPDKIDEDEIGFKNPFNQKEL